VPIVYRVGRAVISAAVSIVFVLPLLSLFHHVDVAWATKSLVAGVVLVSAIRPGDGLVIITGLLPLALGLEVLAGGPPAAAELTEILAYGFLAGAAWHVTMPAPGTRDRLARPAMVLAAIAVTSLLVELGATQAADGARRVASELLIHVTREYAFEDGTFVSFHETMHWLGGLALCVFVERLLRKLPELGPLVLRIWFVAGAAASAFAILRISQVLIEGKVGPPLAALKFLVQNVRLSVLHADPNAAGSYFVLLLVPAIACFASQSRSAIAAGFIVLSIVWLARGAKGWRIRLGAVALLVLAGGSLAVWMMRSASHAAPVVALSLRAELNEVSMRMAREYPVFGVGLSHYRGQSRRFITPDLPGVSTWAPRGENAHNNFMQILVELGVPGLIAFLWLVLPQSLPWRRQAEGGNAWPGHAQALGAGLAAFLISALFGHPLLITQVLVAFFLALGMAAGASPAPAGRGNLGRALAWVMVVLALAALPWRLARASSDQRLSAGLGDVAGEIDGISYRVVHGRATFRVAESARAVTFPLRWAAAGGADCEVAILLDERPADRVILVADAWRTTSFSLPTRRIGSARGELTLAVSSDRCQLLVGPVQFI
jgi:hypothetical protein